MNQTIDLLKSHRSIRKYKDKPIDQAVLQTLIESGQWASTSSYVQAYSVIRVKNPEKREAMALYREIKKMFEQHQNSWSFVQI